MILLFFLSLSYGNAFTIRQERLVRAVAFEELRLMLYLTLIDLAIFVLCENSTVSSGQELYRFISLFKVKGNTSKFSNVHLYKQPRALKLKIIFEKSLCVLL